MDRPKFQPLMILVLRHAALVELVSVASFFADLLNLFDGQIGEQEDQDDVHPALEEGGNLLVVESCSLKPVYNVSR
jgi:hypothetical protein